jgi:CAAX protease family protein
MLQKVLVLKKHKLYLIGILSILVLLFLISLTGFPFFLNMLGLPAMTSTLFFISRMLYWLSLLLLWLYAIKVEKENLLIWKERKYSFLIYLLFVIAIYVILFAGALIIQTLLSFTRFSSNSNILHQIINILKKNKILLVFTALTAGVVEELIMRGYIQPRLEILSRSPYAAMIISSLLFGLLHYKYGTLINVVGPVFIGLVFAFYYWKYRNIKVLIITHFLWDLISLMVVNGH